MDENQNKLHNKGYLYRNKRKNKQTQPDMTGKVNVDGKEKQFSAWEKTDKNGEKFLSVSISDLFVRPEGDNPGQGAQGNQNGGGQSNPPSNYNNNSNNYSGGSNQPKSTSQHPDNNLDELNSLFDN